MFRLGSKQIGSREIPLIGIVALGLCVGLAQTSGAADPKKPASAPLPSIELAQGLIDAEQFGQALDVLKAIDITDDASAAQVDLLLGQLYLGLGKPAKSEEYFEHAALSSMDVDAPSLLGMAEAELSMGNLSKARINAANALKTDPDLVAAQLVLARADLRVGRGAQALNRLQQLQRNQPDSENVTLVLARYVAQQSGPAAGIGVLQPFIAQNPNAAAAYDALGQFYWGMGRKPEALQARSTAQHLYKLRGQTGRADAMAAWITAVAPRYTPPIVTPPPPHAAPNDEPPKPVAAPRAPVEAAPLLAPPLPTPPKAKPSPLTENPPPASPPLRKVPQWTTMTHPDPLPFAPGSMLMTGSGIVLEGGMQIITNRHVIEGMNVIYVRNGTGHVRKAHVAKVSRDDDLALLEIDAPFPENAVIPLADLIDPAPGRTAIVMGFPLINILGDEQPSLTEGIVSKNLGLANDPNTFQMTAKVNKGNSGGPVFDNRGHLIGVTVAKMDSASIYQHSGAMAEDINLGIKADRILNFLGKAPNPTLMSTAESGPEISLEDLYQQMLPRAVLVAAQK